jgi:hypothetical protein
LVGFELITYKGKAIFFQNIAGSKNIEENISVFDKTKEQIVKQPPKSVLLLTDVTDAFYNTVAAERLKQFSKDVTPYVKASAAVGISGLKKIILEAMARVSGRKIEIFDTLDQAKEWLVSQP